MRLPGDVEEGSFEVGCSECDEIIELDISILSSGRERIRINGVPFLNRRPARPAKDTSKRTVVEVIEEVDTVNYNRRLKIVMVLFVIIALLGVASSITTVTSSFSIKNLEERTQSDLSNFSVWVIDSETGRSIEGATVSISSGNSNRTGITDNEGLLVFEGVRTGPWTIRLEADGYKTTSGDLNIMKGSPNVIDIPMEKGDPKEVVPMLTKQFRSEEYSTSYTNIMAFTMFISSILALAGAYLVNKKEFFTLTVVIAFLTIFSFGFLIGSILSLVVIFLLIISYNGFSHDYNLRMLLESQGREDLKQLFRKDEGNVIGLPPKR